MNLGYGKYSQSLPPFVLRLRAVILALGESTSPVWWETKFMNETGLRFLERLYPRTYFQAAIHATGKAALYAHDRAVGRVGVYHIFRLPESIEAEINKISPDFDEEFISHFRIALGQQDKLMNLLAPLCSQAGTDTAPGAKKIGTSKDLLEISGFKKAAAVYYHDFNQGKQGFPYFTVEQTGVRR